MLLISKISIFTLFTHFEEPEEILKRIEDTSLVLYGLKCAMKQGLNFYCDSKTIITAVSIFMNESLHKTTSLGCNPITQAKEVWPWTQKGQDLALGNDPSKQG